MGNKEYAVIEILDVLRRYQAGDGSSPIAKATSIARNTVRKYIRLAEDKGFTRDSDADLEEIAYAVFREIHADGNGSDDGSRDGLPLPWQKTFLIQTTPKSR